MDGRQFDMDSTWHRQVFQTEDYCLASFHSRFLCRDMDMRSAVLYSTVEPLTHTASGVSTDMPRTSLGWSLETVARTDEHVNAMIVDTLIL